MPRSWKGDGRRVTLFEHSYTSLAIQEFSTIVHYCGLSVQTFIERGSVMQIPVLYSTIAVIIPRHLQFWSRANGLVLNGSK